MSKVAKTFRLTLAYFWFNLKGSYAFRSSFWLQVASMAFNDGIWVMFWLLYFARFPVVQGWHRTDILYLWGLSAFSFGIMDIVFGNALNLGRIISEGELDIYLSQPRPPLYHALISRQNVVGWGDVGFGLGMLLLATPHTLPALGQTLVSVSACTLLLIGFVVLTQSLVFFIGGREGLGAQLAEVFLTFSHYPSGIFHGVVIRVLIFGIVPAGLVSSLPLAVIDAVHPWLMWISLAVGVLEVGLAYKVFQLGLRVYTSGNRLTVRS
ncbi:MAG: ABC-2 family transporter protein [Alicyclobacillus herbarius]|uniref:ABC transporter permease n=1 Tax=Alicyclobacillus herbarius TaxID=122960 RepID=UPI0023561102|nr:ABC-2 family transporter protein [Alicyclobacillus herbarius]MCL6632588.1 ABC-2 family transporter protein [Alicyclobacillus herbarius]